MRQPFDCGVSPEGAPSPLSWVQVSWPRPPWRWQLGQRLSIVRSKAVSSPRFAVLATRTPKAAALPISLPSRELLRGYCRRAQSKAGMAYEPLPSFSAPLDMVTWIGVSVNMKASWAQPASADRSAISRPTSS